MLIFLAGDKGRIAIGSEDIMKNRIRAWKKKISVP